MPWTPKQMKSIQARAHGWMGAGAFRNVGRTKARKMAKEGMREKTVKRIVSRREREFK